MSTWMTPHPHNVPVNADLAAVQALFDDHSFHHLPVVEKGRLVGVIERADLPDALGDTVDALDLHPVPTIPLEATLLETMEALAGGSLDCVIQVDSGWPVAICTERDALALAIELLSDAYTVSDYASQATCTLPHGAPAAEARTTFATQLPRHLILLDDDGSFWGVLSKRDLAGAADETPVCELVSEVQHHIGLDASVAEAARVMAAEALGVLPILGDADVPTHVISRLDVLAALIASLR